jgi:hypothetical protein
MSPQREPRGNAAHWDLAALGSHGSSGQAVGGSRSAYERWTSLAKFSRQSIGPLESAVMSVMHGIELIGQLKYAVLERDGQISIVPR